MSSQMHNALYDFCFLLLCQQDNPRAFDWWFNVHMFANAH
jgi:hypothetical protein